MKKFFALASMMIVLSVSAQQHKSNYGSKDKFEHKVVHAKKQDYPISPYKSSTYQNAKQFERYDLSSSQRKKINSLFDTRQKDLKDSKHKRGFDYAKYDKDFEKKIEKILSKKQYQQYKKDQYKGNKSRHIQGKQPQVKVIKRGF